MASSSSFGSRSRMATMRSSSSSVSPSERWRASEASTASPYRTALSIREQRPELLFKGGVGCLIIGEGSFTILQMPAKAKRTRSPMSDRHKAALAEGREQGRAVRRYLEALEAHKPKRGRKRTPESIEKRLAAIEERLPDADPLTRLQLVQERMDLQRQLEPADSR